MMFVVHVIFPSCCGLPNIAMQTWRQ
jgi:hypothetical protein